MHKLWLRIHLYIGLGAGLVFVFIGLTGSVLVFYRSIDGWLNPTLLTASMPGESRPLDELIASLRSGTPDLPGPSYLDLPRTNTDVVHAWYRMCEGPHQDNHDLEVLLDPATGHVLGRRSYGRHLTTVVYGLHRELLIGNAGEMVVGTVGIGLLLSLSTGVYLWWPKRGQFWQTFRLGRGISPLQRQYHLHKTSGIVAATILILIGCSGIFIEFHEWLTPIVRLMSPVNNEEPAVSASFRAGKLRISAQQAVELARERFPDGEVKYLTLADGPMGVYIVGIRQPDEILKTSSLSGVWIDQYSGELLAVWDWKQFTAGETFVAWMFPLNNGEAFGLPGRWIVFLIGFVPSVLYVTALRMWWLKRQAHRRQRLAPAFSR